MSKTEKETILILHNIRSTHNVGSLMRSADGAGVSQIIFSGYTPTPLDKYGRKRSDVTKTALGAENMAWQKIDSLDEYLNKLRAENFLISAIEQSPKSVHYKKSKKSKKQALILGNEVTGIEPEVLKIVDQVIEIPMLGDKESLNVSIAGAIVMFEILT